MKKDSEVRKLRVWGLQRPERLQRRRMALSFGKCWAQEAELLPGFDGIAMAYFSFQTH